METLSITDLNNALEQLQEWHLTVDVITREFHFKDFKESMTFANNIAEEAEKMNHHPDILIRYNKVTLTLTTHSAGGLTQKDFELAKIIDKLV